MKYMPQIYLKVNSIFDQTLNTYNKFSYKFKIFNQNEIK